MRAGALKAYDPPTPPLAQLKRSLRPQLTLPATRHLPPVPKAQNGGGNTPSRSCQHECTPSIQGQQKFRRISLVIRTIQRTQTILFLCNPCPTDKPKVSRWLAMRRVGIAQLMLVQADTVPSNGNDTTPIRPCKHQPRLYYDFPMHTRTKQVMQKPL